MDNKKLYKELDITKEKFSSNLLRNEKLHYYSSFQVNAVYFFCKVRRKNKILSDYFLVFPYLLLLFSKRFRRLFLCYGWAVFVCHIDVIAIKNDQAVCFMNSPVGWGDNPNNNG